MLTDATDQLANVVAQSAIDAFIIQKSAIDDFSRAIESLVDEIGKSQDLNLPICIMIDELDRCRPTYAIELLESVKHLFAIKGIFFIIATDTKQLAHSIKAVYGNDFDSISYLKRFFYAEFNLARPNGLTLSRALFNGEWFINQLFLSDSIKSKYTFDLIFTYICDLFNLNIRDREQIFAILKSFVFSSGEEVDFILLLILICLKKMDFAKYKKSLNLRSLSPINEYLAANQAGRKSYPLTLDYQPKEGGSSMRYSIQQQKCDMVDVIKFYAKLFDSLNLAGALDKYEERSHFIYQLEVCQHFTSASANSLESYFSLIDQAGRVSMNQ